MLFRCYIAKALVNRLDYSKSGVEYMRNIYKVQTPENVTLEFELAGIGSRGVALAIDIFIQNAILFAITLIVVLIAGNDVLDLWNARNNTIYIVIALLLFFIIQSGYFILLELFMKGSTIGKKVVGLQVIMANGEPVSFTAILIRNIMRIGDMLPGIYGVAILSVFLNERYMRIGDLAANTIVIKINNHKNVFSDIQSTFTEHRDIVITPKEESLLMEYRNRCKSPKNPIYSITLDNQLYYHFYKKIGPLPGLPANFTKGMYLKVLFEYLSK